MAMKIRTLGRHVREGVKNIGRNGWMTMASVISVAITLLILGVFLLLALNVNYIAESYEDQVEIRFFMDLTSGEEERQKVERKLRAIPEVDQESIVFIPKEEGLDQIIESMGDEGKHFESFREDSSFLPDTFVVQALDPQKTANVAKRIEKFEHVYKVVYGEGTVEKLFAVTNTVRNIGLIFIIGLAFTAMFLIANTIKITIIARSKEIEIMKLVGATNGFIRWPFFIEGLLLGIIGALIPIGILFFGYQQLLYGVGDYLKIHFLELLPMYPLAYEMALLLLGIGAFIGIWGSLMSIRRFLRV
jgi:cell division transport system permease protein